MTKRNESENERNEGKNESNEGNHAYGGRVN